MIPRPTSPHSAEGQHGPDSAVGQPSPDNVEGRLRSPATPDVQSLGRNALWLMISSGGTASLGLVYWAVASHRYSVEQYGRDGAVLSAMIGISAIGQLNLPQALLRFLPAIGQRRPRVALASFAAVVLASAAIAAVALGVFRTSVDGLSAATSNLGVATCFVIGAALWSAFVLQDSVLIAIRQSVWVPVENIGFAVIKIVLVLAFAQSLGGFGIFFSWFLAMVVVLVPVNVWVNILVWRGRSEPVQRSAVLDRLGRRGVIRMIGLDYGAAVVGQAYAQFLPVVVLATAGVVGSAAFIVPFTAAVALDTLALALLQSFTAEAARDEGRMTQLARASAVRMAALVIAGTLAVELGAPLLLLPFGAKAGGLSITLMRILILASISRAVLALFETVCRMQGRAGLILGLQLLVGVGAIGFGVAGGHLGGATGVAWAWVLTHLVLALAVTPLLRRQLSSRGSAGLNSSPVTPPSMDHV